MLITNKMNNLAVSILKITDAFHYVEASLKVG